MNSRDLARYLVLGGVVAGLSAGTSLRADQARTTAAGLNQATSQAVQMADTRQELFNLRFQSVTGALENTARLKLAKREIARILTVRNDRQGAAAERN